MLGGLRPLLLLLLTLRPVLLLLLLLLVRERPRCVVKEEGDGCWGCVEEGSKFARLEN